MQKNRKVVNKYILYDINKDYLSIMCEYKDSLMKVNINQLAGWLYHKYIKKLQVSSRLSKFHKPYKLNLACGKNTLDGWVNIDSEKSLTDLDFQWDLRYGIPVEDDSVSLIYCEHFLEHLKVQHGVAFLRECKRVLMPEGVLRIAMPDLGHVLGKVEEGKWNDQDWLSWAAYKNIKTKAEMLNIAFRSWGHEWLYDSEELYRRLEESGFNKFKSCQWSESTTPSLCNLESRKDSILICEATK